MKKFVKKIIFATILSCLALVFANGAYADENNAASLSISGTGITSSGSTYTVSAAPGSEISFDLIVNTTGGLTYLKVPWNAKSINSKLTYVSSSAVEGFTKAVTNGTSLQDTFGGYASEGALTGTNGKIKVLTFKFKVYDTFKSDEVITLTFGDGTNNTYMNNSDNQKVSLSGLTLKIAYKAPSSGGDDTNGSGNGSNSGNESNSGNGSNSETPTTGIDGITIPSGESITNEYKATSSGDATVTETTAKIKFTVDSDDQKCYVYRSTEKDKGYELVTKEPIACGKAKAGEFEDKNLKAGTTYYYRVRVVGSKAVSDAIIVKTTAAATEATKENKTGNVSGKTDTGAFIPVAIIALLGTGFVVIRKYNSKNKLFNRI